MTERVEKYLYDVLYAIDNIEQFVGTPKIFEDYRTDYKTKSAVERQLGIIGEAVNKILKEESSVIISNARDIINLRNRIIHAYDSVNDAVIWAIIINRLPELRAEIENFMK
ncbi:MAG: antitoxin [Bacteroidetes bacterium]|nr:MAG: antitoxin [Bacteroidota bacterium]